MKRFIGLIILIFAITGCTYFDDPEGIAELSVNSIHTRTERPSANEEVVYCSADVKITNVSDRTIYNCTVNAVATSDKGIDHYISLNYDVNIPPYKSLYLNIEWSLVRQIETSSVTVSESSSDAESTSNSNSKSNSTTNNTNTLDSTSHTDGETKTETHTKNDSSSPTKPTSDSDTTSKPDTTTTTNSLTTDVGSSESSSKSNTTETNNTKGHTVTTTTSTTFISSTNEETDWDKSSVRILDYYFN